MNGIDRSQLLQEFRSLTRQAGAGEIGGAMLPLSPATNPAGAANGMQGGVQQFSNLFSKALDNVNQLQQTAGDLQTRVEMGDKSVSLVQAMVASQKANIAFQATVQVRNRLVAAYQDIMNMPI